MRSLGRAEDERQRVNDECSVNTVTCIAVSEGLKFSQDGFITPSLGRVKQRLITGLNFTLYLFPMLDWDAFVVSVFGCLGFSPSKRKMKLDFWEKGQIFLAF